MKNIPNKLIISLLTTLIIPFLGTSQDTLPNELSYEVNRIYPPISKTKQELTEAQTLKDLNKYYKSSWIREYVSVEVLTSYKGKMMKALGKNEVLNQEQKERMERADVGMDILVRVQYIPENNLTRNDIKEIDFTISIEPEQEASYPGGPQQLKKYLQEKAIAKIPEGSFKGYDLKAIRFTISEAGEVGDVHMFGAEYETSKNKAIDQLLLEAVRNMPCWEPAAYADGTKASQEFVLMVGSMENCMVPLLNIQREKIVGND